MPTLDDIWLEDRLGRRDDAVYIESFLTSRVAERKAAGQTASHVLNVNAQWGTGKSFFMKRLAMQLRESGHLVAEVDAWATDHADDPLLAVMAAIEDAAKPLMERSAGRQLKTTLGNLRRNAGGIAVAAAKGALLQGARKLIGDGVEQVSELVDGPIAEGRYNLGAVAEAGARGGSDAVINRLETLLDQTAAQQVDLFRKGQASITAFKRDLAKLIGILAEKQMSPTLYVLIDELDRCRPTYAISLLERTKHLFDVDDVVVVVATDTAQLANSVRAVYGPDFGGRSYLSRFFDRSYQFDEPDLELFLRDLVIRQPINESLVSVPPEQTVLSTVLHVFSAYGSTPRDIQRSYDLLRTVATTWSSKAKIELTAMLPLIVAYQAGHSAKWEDEETEAYLSAGIRTIPPIRWRYREDGGNFQIQEAKVYIADIVKIWRQYRSQPLKDLSGLANSKPAGTWILDGMRDEFRLVHGNTSSIGGEQISIVNRYPAIIHKAGRFST